MEVLGSLRLLPCKGSRWAFTLCDGEAEWADWMGCSQAPHPDAHSGHFSQTPQGKAGQVALALEGASEHSFLIPVQLTHLG